MKTQLPTYDEIAQLAHQIWQDQGQPSGHDLENWFEAERRLTVAAAQALDEETDSSQTRPLMTESMSEFSDRAKVETAAESVVEYHISPAVSDEEALRAAMQRKEARMPKVPTHQGPTAKPAETGRPVWSQAHSS